MTKINYKWGRLINPKRTKIDDPWRSHEYWQYNSKESLKKAIQSKEVRGYKDGRITITKKTRTLEVLPLDVSLLSSLKKTRKNNFNNRKKERLAFFMEKGIGLTQAERLWAKELPWSYEGEVIDLALTLKDRRPTKVLPCQSDPDFRGEFKTAYSMNTHLTNSRIEAAIRISKVL